MLNYGVQFLSSLMGEELWIIEISCLLLEGLLDQRI